MRAVTILAVVASLLGWWPRRYDCSWTTCSNTTRWTDCEDHRRARAVIATEDQYAVSNMIDALAREGVYGSVKPHSVSCSRSE